MRRAALCLRVLLLICAVWGLGGSARAQLLRVYPNTWNVIGLDSNNQNDGPNFFLVGTRVCNEAGTGGPAALGLSAQYIQYLNNAPNIALSGLGTLTLASLPSGPVAPSPYSSTSRPANCFDFYFNGVITRTSAAFSSSGSTPALRNTEPYYIQVTSSNAATVRTPNTLDGTGLRELYVERLVSQSRNSVSALSGPATVVVGKTYTYSFVGSTATNGYEQLEHFPSFPNNLFQIEGIATTYSTSGFALNSIAYADACGWQNNPLIANYLGCAGNGKAGGNIATTYTVRIVGPGNGAINNLIYDYSGSSYHYNDDYNSDAPFNFTAVNPPSLTLSKSTSTPILIRNGSSLIARYTLTALNSSAPSTGTASSVLIRDDLSSSFPGATLSGTPTITLSGGATRPLVSNPSVGQSVLNWGSFTLPAGGQVSIAFDVSIPTSTPNGVYQNGFTASYNDPDGLAGTGAAYLSGSSTAEDVTLRNGSADLQVLKTASRRAPELGSALVYTVSVTNLGPDATSGVTVTDLLPSGVTLAPPASATQGSYTPSSGLWTVGSLGVGASATLTLPVTVTQTSSGPITNTASVSASSVPDLVSTNNSASVQVLANPLSLVKSVRNISQGTVALSSVQAKPGDLLEYCITFTNFLNQALSFVQISDPAGSSTLYQTGSLTLNGLSLSDALDADAGSVVAGAVSVQVVALSSSGSGQVCFRVQVL